MSPAHGAALMQINIRDLRNLLVRFPSRGELKKLFAKFDELAENTQHLEGHYQQKFRTLDTLKKSLLHQAFSGNL